MEVERARLAGVFAEPPMQQLRRGGRDQVVQVDGAGFQAIAELLGMSGQGSGEDQRVVGRFGGHGRPSARLRSINKWFMVGLPHVRTTGATRSEEHTSELQSLMRISYAVFCLKKTIIK